MLSEVEASLPLRLTTLDSDSSMKPQLCQLLAYCETSGAPVGICSLTKAQAWRGAEYEQTLYWDVVQNIGQTLLFEFDAAHHFFDTETGNFALYRFRDGAELVIAEVVYIEEEAVIPLNGIHFTCNVDTQASFKLKGLTCFFDSALTLPSTLLSCPSLYAVAQAVPWDVAVLDCDYDVAYEVIFKSATILLQGICLRKQDS